MRDLGIEAFDIINIEHIQSQWAFERGVNRTGHRLIIEQIKLFNPDVVFFQDSSYFSDSFFKAVREIPSVKLLITMYGSPVTKEYFQMYKNFDIVLGNSPLFVEKLRFHGIKSYLVGR